MARARETVTRFAPSPTGFLHIGGARTALFNWLYARGREGRFLLRIEDTDRARSTPEATQAILDGLAWLGLDWDGEPISQFARAERHVAAAERLLESGRAYRDFLTPEETNALKDAFRERGEAFRSPWRDRSAADAPPDAPFVVRFTGPTDGETIVEDRVQGAVRFPNKDLDDLVLLRSDGTPPYNLAVVVDDHEMGVTHVIRGDDHLVNAARQSLIYAALDWETPQFAHIPLIHGADGKKLSKRHGALGAEAYRDMGCLPEGLRNYLLRLGWSYGDQEIFSDADAKRLFDLDGVNKAPARLDLDKLESVNAHHLRAAEPDRLLDLAAPFIAKAHPNAALDTERRSRLRAALPHLTARAKTLADLAEATGFLFAARPLSIEGKTRKALTDEAVARLARLRARLASVEVWEAEPLKAALDAFAADEEVGFGKVGGPLRAALTGGAPAPDIAVVLALLGREQALGRIEDVSAVAA
ncbi:MAG: glutamate--tRNA ligase [Caulobacterales bacterium]|nr:glutamate--tRNA ligase [Caulobacterales bacterium]